MAEPRAEGVGEWFAAAAVVATICAVVALLPVVLFGAGIAVLVRWEPTMHHRWLAIGLMVAGVVTGAWFWADDFL